MENDPFLNYCSGCLLSPCGLSLNYCEMSALRYADDFPEPDSSFFGETDDCESARLPEPPKNEFPFLSDVDFPF